MKKVLLLSLVGLLGSACATTGQTNAAQTTAPQTQQEQATAQIADKDLWQSTSEPGEVTEQACTRCGILEQQRELEEISQQVLQQAQETGKTVRELLTPSVLQP